MNGLKKIYMACLRQRDNLPMAALWFMVVVLGTMVVLSPVPQHIVVYNAKHTIDLFTSQLATTKLPPEKIEALSKRFSQVLQATVEDYAMSHHVVILKPSSVISSHDDVTSAIEAQLAINMRVANQ